MKTAPTEDPKLSRLEYVATAALQGILAHEGRHAGSIDSKNPPYDLEYVAKSSVAYAKALLAELARESGNQTR